MTRIEEIRERLSKATPGPWEFQRWPCESLDQAVDWFRKSVEKGNGFHIWAVGGKDPDDVVICLTGNGPRSEHHAAILSLYPSDLAYLLDRIEKLEAVYEAAKEVDASIPATYDEKDPDVQEEINTVLSPDFDPDTSCGPCCCGRECIDIAKAYIVQAAKLKVAEGALVEYQNLRWSPVTDGSGPVDCSPNEKGLYRFLGQAHDIIVNALSKIREEAKP